MKKESRCCIGLQGKTPILKKFRMGSKKKSLTLKEEIYTREK